MDTFRDVGNFPDDRGKRGCSASSRAPRARGLHRVLVNVGPGARQTVFHLHWHVLGGEVDRARVAAALLEGAEA